MNHDFDPDSLALAAAWLRAADGLIITAGAGMGVDSGLPDFRGNDGFWRAYPALKAAGIDFSAIACPAAFTDDPHRTWGFYGHRLDLYRRTAPHAGFQILRAWAERLPQGAFVFTSNVDGQFQRSGFPEAQVEECHGSIHYLQCLAGCGAPIWPAAELTVAVDMEQCRWLTELPRCPGCGGLARPNILMFADGGWQPERHRAQAARRNAWLARLQRPVVLELGAGTAIPSVRRFGELFDAPLIRINPRDAQARSGALSFATGALAALQALDPLVMA